MDCEIRKYVYGGLQDTDVRVRDSVILQWSNRKCTLGGVDLVIAEVILMLLAFWIPCDPQTKKDQTCQRNLLWRKPEEAPSVQDVNCPVQCISCYHGQIRSPGACFTRLNRHMRGLLCMSNSGYLIEVLGRGGPKKPMCTATGYW